MAGTIITIIPKTDMTMTPVGTTTASTILARHVNVTPYREAVIVARVHAKSTSATAQTMSVVVVNVAPSADDPSTDFASATALATLTFDISASTNAPSVQFAPVTAPFGPYVRILMQYSQATQNNAMTASVSVDLVVRE